MTLADAINMYSKLHTCLVPGDKKSIDEYKKINNGEVIIKVSEKPRNYEHHKKLFAIMQFCVDNSDFTGSVDDFLVAVKYEIGFVEHKKRIDGDDIILPKSINFEKAGQETFQQFYEKALNCMSNYMKMSVNDIENMSKLNSAIN